MLTTQEIEAFAQEHNLTFEKALATFATSPDRVQKRRFFAYAALEKATFEKNFALSQSVAVEHHAPVRKDDPFEIEISREAEASGRTPERVLAAWATDPIKKPAFHAYMRRFNAEFAKNNRRI